MQPTTADADKAVLNAALNAPVPPSASVLPPEIQQQMMASWIQSQILAGNLGLSYSEQQRFLLPQQMNAAAFGPLPVQQPVVAPVPPPTKAQSSKLIKCASCSTKKPKTAFAAGATQKMCPFDA